MLDHTYSKQESIQSIKDRRIKWSSNYDIVTGIFTDIVTDRLSSKDSPILKNMTEENFSSLFYFASQKLYGSCYTLHKIRLTQFHGGKMKSELDAENRWIKGFWNLRDTTQNVWKQSGFYLRFYVNRFVYW